MMDIVVMYCDDNDKEWQKSFDKYKEIELEKGLTTLSDRQAFGIERYRDWGAFKYWFRGVEQNCKWLHNVILVVANEGQVPSWLDTNNPKLRVVYHEDFVPKELLPTFNGLTPEFYLSYIKGLTDNYVYCNDDFYFLNNVSSERFFRNNKLVFDNSKKDFAYFNKELEKGSDGTFYKCLNNNLKFLYEHTGGECSAYANPHLPTIRNVSFEKKIIEENKNFFLDAHSHSKFRNKYIYTSALFNWLYRENRECLQENMYAKSKYITLKSDVNFEDCYNYEMVCFNDTEQLDNFDVTKFKLLKFLNSKLPDKSSFEKEVHNDNIQVSVIIPVYNQELLLKRCINSIPKIEGVEIIIIDDGSTDNTASVIGGYVGEYPEYVGAIICKTNHGVGYARNLGLNKARGSYVLFIDSDDYIDGDVFKYIINSYIGQDKYDMIFYDMKANNDEIFEAKSIYLNARCGCYKFIKRSFIGEIRFPVGVNYGEDRIFYNELLEKKPKCKFTKKVMYYYNYPRKNSLCDIHGKKVRTKYTN